MKVKVTFTLDVDAKAWALEYGIDASEVRGDVQEYLYSQSLGHLDALGLLAKS